MVFLVIWAEFRLSSLEYLLNGLATVELGVFDNFKYPHTVLRWAGFFVGLCGTLVWGYGDLLYEKSTSFI